MERKDGDDWVSACRSIEVAGVRGRSKGRKTWDEFVKGDMDLFGLRREWVLDKLMWRSSIWGHRPTREGTKIGTLIRRS